MPPESKKLWEEKIIRSGYFFGALLLHAVVFLLVATLVIWQSPPKEPDTAIFHPANVPPKHDTATTTTDVTPTAPNGDISSSTATTTGSISVISNQTSGLKIEVPIPKPGTSGSDAGINIGFKPGPVSTTPGMTHERALAVREFVLAHQNLSDILEGTLKAKFPVYVAAYAEGDWSCNLQLDQDGNIVAGSIPNLVAKIDQWTHGDVQPEVMPKPLNIGGYELLKQQPPFIFFTGHKDFVLTDQEVANLQRYVFEGGLIWGDNALAGQGSRFDVAFQREMKRVIPDKDKNFEPVAPDADVFTKEHFAITELPPGMNRYAEPMQHIDLDGKMAILYTPNDYSDILDMRILPDDATQQLPYWGMPPRTLYTNVEFWSHQNVYYRNFTINSSLAVHRLGTNIVTFLLTRFNSDILLNP